jgi:xylan 1,4-beta-xylosidase
MKKQTAVSPAKKNEPRVIESDLSQLKGPRSMVWSDCVGAGRIGEGLRESWRKQLEHCHKEFGFRYLRAHGLLHDEMRVYSEDKNGKPVYNFMYIDDVYDFLLSIGMKPFVELGFMPEKLASVPSADTKPGDATVFWWKANVTPPKKYEKWDALIKTLVQHWTDRYGAEELKTWRFEVWNEPNLNIFWRLSDEERLPEYLKLYEHTAKAVKSVNKDYPVGGPSGAGPVFIEELIDYCNKKKLPLDFITYHTYGLGDGPSGLDQFGNRKLFLHPSLHYVCDMANQPLPVIEKKGKKKLPVYITEWNSSYSPVDPVHDSFFAGPFILEQLRNTEALDSMSFWTFTDIFEENGPAPRPFHGGFGLMSYQGIPKAAYWAYKYLSLLGNTEVVSSDKSSYVCRDDKGGVQVLFWDLTHPTDGGKVSNQDFFFKTVPATANGETSVILHHLPAGKYDIKVFMIGFQQNDPYTLWLNAGAPTDLTREDVEELKKNSAMEPVFQSDMDVEGMVTLTMPVQTNSVYFITLTPIKLAPVKAAPARKAEAKPAVKAPEKKAEAKPVAKPAENPAPAKAAEKAPAKKAEAKAAAKPAEKPVPAKKAEVKAPAKPAAKPAPAKKAEVKAPAKPAAKPAPAKKAEVKAPAKPAAKPAPAKATEKAPAKKAEAKAPVKPVAKPAAKPAAKTAPAKAAPAKKAEVKAPAKPVPAKKAEVKAPAKPAAKPAPAKKAEVKAPAKPAAKPAPAKKPAAKPAAKPAPAKKAEAKAPAKPAAKPAAKTAPAKKGGKK